MRPAPLLPLLVTALALAACDQTGGQNPTPPPPGPTTAGPPPATPPAGGATAPVEITSADGGAEQAPGSTLPAGPPTPVAGPPQTSAGGFEHHEAGDLIPGSGPGYLDRTVWSPDLCFPLENVGFANSQVYGPGGAKGPPGMTNQCDHANYSPPWRDNFCEARGYASPVCAGGKGHQGQDIRPFTCQRDVHWVVAAEAGTITDVGGYSITLTSSAPPHRVYRYLHLAMSDLSVHEGDSVQAGDRLGKAANDFGATPTTIHLHFEIRAGVAATTTDGKPVVLHTFLPPYLSLVGAYQRKFDGQTCH